VEIKYSTKREEELGIEASNIKFIEKRLKVPRLIAQIVSQISYIQEVKRV
jgi:hypothetical protein